MSKRPLTYMAIAANHNRLGMVFMIDKQPMDWELSYVAASSPDRAYEHVSQWIKHYGADVIVSQDPHDRTRKGQRTKALIEAIAKSAQISDAQHITVPQEQPYRSKYEQIEDLVTRYPQMKAAAPIKRKFYEHEPHSVTIFEALAMADRAIQ